MTIADGSQLSPGNSVGTMLFDSILLDGGGILNWEIGSTEGSPGTGWDLVDMANSAEILATAQNPFAVNLYTLDSAGDPGLLADFDPLQDYSWTFLTADSILGFDPSYFSLDWSNFANDLNGGSFSISQAGSNLQLDYTSAVPEPGSFSFWEALGSPAAY